MLWLPCFYSVGGAASMVVIEVVGRELSYISVVLMSRIVNFFTKLSDQRERTTVNRAVARIWLAALPPCGKG